MGREIDALLKHGVVNVLKRLTNGKIQETFGGLTKF